VESSAYYQMINFLSTPYFEISDVLRKLKGYHPPTVGDVVERRGEILPREVALTGKDDQKIPQRLDYIFWVTRRPLIPVDPLEMKTMLGCRAFERLLEKDPLPEGLVTVGDLFGNLRLKMVTESYVQFKQGAYKSNEFCAAAGNRRMEIKSCEVEPFFVRGEEFTQLSDHYGVSCIIIIQ